MMALITVTRDALSENHSAKVVLALQKLVLQRARPRGKEYSNEL
jgi:hypothetical protein